MLARRRTLTLAILAAAGTACALRVAAYQEDPPNLKAPWHFAPKERKIVGRDPADIRPEGTALGEVTHVPKLYSEKELHDRAIALYEGNRLGTSRAPGATPPERAAPATPAAAASPALGAGWRCLVVCLAGAVVVAGVYGWARLSERKRAAASRARAAPKGSGRPRG
jgi:hypothetical protein